MVLGDGVFTPWQLYSIIQQTRIVHFKIPSSLYFLFLFLRVGWGGGVFDCETRSKSIRFPRMTMWKSTQIFISHITSLYQCLTHCKHCRVHCCTASLTLTLIILYKAHASCQSATSCSKICDSYLPQATITLQPPPLPPTRRSVQECQTYLLTETCPKRTKNIREVCRRQF